MIKSIITSIVRQKNSSFQFDKTINNRMIGELLLTKVIQQLRAFRLLLSGKNPLKIFFGPRVKLSYAQNINFGKFIQIEHDVHISGLGKEGVTLGNNVRIGAYSKLIVGTGFDNLGSFIKIKDNVGIGEYAYLGGGGGLTIGEDCIIGQYLSCHPENHNYSDPIELIRHQGTTRKGITIGSNCWIGSKVTILDGVNIGANSVIAAGAVVTKSTPPNSIIGGVPAKIIKTRTTNPSLKKQIA